MPLFNWTDSKYSVNIKELDQQHKRLVYIANQLYDAKQDNTDNEILGKVLDELVNYTETHFKKEEELMEQYEYPDYAEHKPKHDSLTQRVLDMQKKYYCGNADIAVDIAILLNDWIAEHILVEDKKYSPYFSESNVT